MYLKQANISESLGFMVKEKVLKAMESNPSMEYGMATMHTTLLECVPSLTLEYHKERLVAPKIHRTSMCSQPWDRNYSRYVYQIRDSIQRAYARAYSRFYAKKTATAQLSHAQR
jgi:hypothetical protein